MAKATTMNPKQLHAAARRALEAIEADRRKVGAPEDQQLRDGEEEARARVICTVHDNGDGTMRIHAVVPTLAGAILKKILDQMSSPRRGRLGAPNEQAGATGNPNSEGFDWAGEVSTSSTTEAGSRHARPTARTGSADGISEGLTAVYRWSRSV